MATVRRAAVAGAFYPGDPRQLAAEVEDLLGGVEQLEPRFGYPKALVVPHAGYIYSGPVAAAAFDQLAAARGIVKRVVLLGPVHRVPVRGLALPGADVFETPLGRIPVDARAAEMIADLSQVVRSEAAHAMEHSLEVQLPFLQKILRDFALLPLAVGSASVDEVAEVIERLWGGPETLIVVSTDLSHYHVYDEARRIDGATLVRIASFATDLDHEEACGATPLNGMLNVAKKKRLAISLVAACNSGDTAGGRGRVVGYSAFALREDGEVRGCIGSLEPARALGEDVAANAAGAAFRDPRFPAVTHDEWPQCSVEVSLLSTPKPVRFADEADLLAQVRAGEDGIILEYNGKRATYLPQVWEGLPDKRRFFDELKRKAGLPADTRLARCRLWRYRVVKWRQEALQ